MQLTRKNSSVGAVSQSVVGARTHWLILTLLMLALTSPLFIPVLASADNSGDVEANLIRQGWYISNVATQKLKGGQSEKTTLQNTVNELKSKKHPGALAILDNTTIPKQFNGDPDAYAEYLRGYINPKVDIVVVVNGDLSKVGLSAVKLSPAEQKAITDADRSTFTAGSYANGVAKVALDAEKKISDAETSGTIITIVIVLVVIAVIGGAIALLYFTTKNSWKRKLDELQKLNGQVTDLVVRVSDGIDYLPDSNREQVRAQFGQATTNMTNAQANMRELQAATPFQLVLQGGKYRQEMNATSSQLQNSLTMLQQLDRSVEKA